MAVSHTYLFLFSLLLLSSSSNIAYGRHETLGSHLVGVKSLLPETTCSQFSTTGVKRSPSVLPLFNRNGPCFTHKTPNYTHILIQDLARVRSIHSRISRERSSLFSEKTKLPVTSGASLGTANFIVTLGFGTPKNDLPIIFDTASDLTWIQCKPCAGSCYPQRDPIFDPANSSSYSNISCNSSACSALESGTGITPKCSGSTCVYGTEYADQSYSSGFYGKETLTVSPSDVFPNFQFGCGQENDGLFGRAAGLLGLGRDSISFVSQTAEKYKKLFSYCIPFTSSGFLAFGETSTVAKYTPLVSDSRGPSFYFLNMQGISVRGKILPVSASIFSKGGTIIDSGTVITRLPPTAYAALSSEFKKAMSAYKTAPAFSILDTCYNLTGVTNVSIPTISLLFACGTSLDVPSSGIFYTPSMSQACLAFAGNDDDGDTAIIGNRQQRTLTVVYDVAGKKLGFGPGGCT